MGPSKIVADQLKKVQFADLSNFDAEHGVYLIKRKSGIKLEVDNFYHINTPEGELDVEIDSIKPGVISVSGVHHGTSKYFQGQFKIADVSVIAKL